jgi:hypothetical protein
VIRLRTHFFVGSSLNIAHLGRVHTSASEVHRVLGFYSALSQLMASSAFVPDRLLM